MTKQNEIPPPANWGDADPLPEASSEFGVVTPMGAAEMYDKASGVKGWKAEWNADTKRIDLTPPPGYTICYDSDGRPGLFRLSTHSIGISFRKVNE